MRSFVLFVLAACCALAADPWAKVQELKSDTEVRIFKTHSTKPLVGKVEEVHADSIIVALKNEEIAVHKEDIDRLDYRPSQGGTHAAKATTATQSGPAAQAVPEPLHSRAGSGSSTSSSTNYSFGSKPDFQTIYHRVPGK